MSPPCLCPSCREAIPSGVARCPMCGYDGLAPGAIPGAGATLGAPGKPPWLATVVLVCGSTAIGMAALGLCSFFGSIGAIAASVPGIICGHLALGECKRDPALAGRGMALTGTILSWVSVGLVLIWVLLFVVFIAWKPGAPSVPFPR